MAEANEALTADAISEQYAEIMHRYYGADYAHDDLVASYWIRIPHFYYNFYVYKYATSYCAASNIAKRTRLEITPGAWLGAIRLSGLCCARNSPNARCRSSGDAPW